MKTSIITFALLIYCLSVFATNPEVETTESAEVIKVEVNNLVSEIFSEKPDLLKEENEKIKIIIYNQDFRKVREEVIGSMKEINAQSTLVPVIYRSELITSIDNVSYYMLK